MTLSTRGPVTHEDIRPPYVLVVASNAPTWVKRLTDRKYVCDGTADDVQLQDGINAAA